MAEKQRAPFRSATSDYIAIRKRMEDLGLIKPAEGSENGVDVTPRPAPAESTTPTYIYY